MKVLLYCESFRYTNTSFCCFYLQRLPVQKLIKNNEIKGRLSNESLNKNNTG